MQGCGLEGYVVEVVLVTESVKDVAGEEGDPANQKTSGTTEFKH